MTEKEFWLCDPNHWQALLKAWKEREDRTNRRSAALLCLLANINRNPEKRPVPWTIADFMRGKRPRRPTQKQQAASARAFFGPLITAGLAVENPDDQNAGKVAKLDSRPS
jgi:hypothetical protein